MDEIEDLKKIFDEMICNEELIKTLYLYIDIQRKQIEELKW